MHVINELIYIWHGHAIPRFSTGLLKLTDVTHVIDRCATIRIASPQ
jgi:hypothetical protein